MVRRVKATKLIAILLFITIYAMSCTNANGEGHKGKKTMPVKTIEETLKENAKELMSNPGVVGTAQGLCDGEPCIKVYVIKKTPELDQRIPHSLEGYAVVVEETGEVRALPENQD